MKESELLLVLIIAILILLPKELLLLMNVGGRWIWHRLEVLLVWRFRLHGLAHMVLCARLLSIFCL